MPARTLEEYYDLFLRAFNAGDLEGLMSLYDDQAVLVPEPGTTVRGPALKEAIAAFLALKGTMELKLRGTLEGPGTAITYGSWSLNGTGPDGSPVTMSGESTEVVVKQADGTWRIVLDDPWGCA